MDRIEIGFFKNFKECARSPCNGNHFSSNKEGREGGNTYRTILLLLVIALYRVGTTAKS